VKIQMQNQQLSQFMFNQNPYTNQMFNNINNQNMGNNQFGNQLNGQMGVPQMFNQMMGQYSINNISKPNGFNPQNFQTGISNGKFLQ